MSMPKQLIHIVPIAFYDEFRIGDLYDPRNRTRFGNNAPYIHTTPSIEQLTSHLSYFEKMKPSEFYLLKITTDDIDEDNITHCIENGCTYHHLWCSLRREQYELLLASKNECGELEISPLRESLC